jgi:mannose-6-phosphate isomerase-like protein (cupin superfamily)
MKLIRRPSSWELKDSQSRYQVVFMNLESNADWPKESHPGMDQLFFILSGSGTATAGTKEVSLQPGDVLTIPAGTEHAVTASAQGMQLWTVYTPVVPGVFEHKNVQEELRAALEVAPLEYQDSMMSLLQRMEAVAIGEYDEHAHLLESAAQQWTQLVGKKMRAAGRRGRRSPKKKPSLGRGRSTSPRKRSPGRLGRKKSPGRKSKSPGGRRNKSKDSATSRSTSPKETKSQRRRQRKKDLRRSASSSPPSPPSPPVTVMGGGGGSDSGYSPPSAYQETIPIDDGRPRYTHTTPKPTNDLPQYTHSTPKPSSGDVPQAWSPSPAAPASYSSSSSSSSWSPQPASYFPSSSPSSSPDTSPRGGASVVQSGGSTVITGTTVLGDGGKRERFLVE